eukprot:CAMPEP_0168352156 /NCGR_PEP_ID=MMETSP0213-20121227/22369_1 /TAXON_ID=151035 /ORGANISM="Euplotes harpa, Strain FSP1.4" /LENGTH=926 /DNA_ID=CAMNT_0008363285 /DNA_START=845 /DNA_END=3626 /DNA_ORIENTATION=+
MAPVFHRDDDGVQRVHEKNPELSPVEEINHLMIKKESDVNSGIAIKIERSNFSWGGDKIEEDESSKQDKKLKKFQKATKLNEKIKQKTEESKSTISKIKAINNDDSDEETESNFDDNLSLVESDDSTVMTNSSKEKKDIKFKSIITLKNIELEVEKGEFLCIIGEVGSGKSSLLNLIMGDMIYVSDETAEEFENQTADEQCIKEMFERSRAEGVVKVSGSMSFVQQVPWIQNKTLRDNILFGLPMDENRYNSTIEKCQLVKDFEQLDGGDLTEIGEKGINLSGGQKARVSLARAVYSQKDIILMDDPISALDANTKKKIFEELFLEELKDKTRVLVTHAVDFLDRVDRIVIMKHGKIKYIGTYEELKNNDMIQHIIETLKKVSHKQQDEEEHEAQELELKRKKSSDGSNKAVNPGDLDEEEDSLKKNEAGARKMSYLSTKGSKIIMDEFEERVDADWGVYWKYLVSNWMWLAMLVSIPIYSLYAFCGIQSTRYIGVWVDHIQEEDSYKKYVVLVLIYSLGYGLLVTIGFFIIMMSVVNSSNVLHRNMTDKVLRAPINLYFDKTPTGKLLNRFSKDINRIDAEFPFNLTFLVECLSWMGATLFVSTIVSPWSLLSTPFAVVAGFLLIKYYIRSYREMTRIESVTNSPILSNFGETLSGTTTIRCYNKQMEFIDKNHELVDNNLSAYFWSQSLNIWFSIRVQYISSFMMCVSMALCIVYKASADSTTIGVLMIYLLSLQANILWFFRIASDIEGGMVSYDRCNMILAIPQEAFGDYSKPPNWPSEGKIVFDKLCLRYRPETELVLKNLRFEIGGKQKVGVVGRTGAGKSTVCLALCRIIEGESGRILIDGHDISKIDLAYLRSKITIIPQDPTLFEGTLRFNLDPESRCSDSEIERIISKAALKELWDSNKEISTNGENLSSGEKQLI